MTKTKAEPAPEVFNSQQHSRAFPCLFCGTAAAAWASKSLAASHKAGAPRWPARSLNRRLRELFGIQHSDNALLKHLREHESNWNLWDDAENTRP